MSITHTTRIPEDVKALSIDFISSLIPHDGHATIYGLSGDLGSGKTTFTKEVAQVLGIPRDDVTSPTFVIEKIYKIEHTHFTHLIHIDAYRLGSSKELLDIGWEEIIQNPKNLILIEWPEKVEDVMPEFSHTIRCKFIDESTREIILP